MDGEGDRWKRERGEAVNVNHPRGDPSRDLPSPSAVPARIQTGAGLSGVFMETSEEVKAFAGSIGSGGDVHRRGRRDRGRHQSPSSLSLATPPSPQKRRTVEWGRGSLFSHRASNWREGSWWPRVFPGAGRYLGLPMRPQGPFLYFDAGGTGSGANLWLRLGT